MIGAGPGELDKPCAHLARFRPFMFFIMTTLTTDEKTCQANARGQLAAIQASLSIFFPRRDAIVAWLTSFINRSTQKDFILGETESDDLAELKKYLRAHGVTVETVVAA